MNPNLYSSTIQPSRAHDSQRNQSQDKLSNEPHSVLKNFLQTQTNNMFAAKSREAFSQSVSAKPNKFNNKYIQQIAELKRQNLDPNSLKEKVDEYSKFNVKKWRDQIEGGSTKKALGHSDNNIPEKPASSAASSKPPRAAERENQISMPEIKSAVEAGQTRNFKSQWNVSNSLGLVGLVHSNGYPQKEILPASMHPEIPTYLRSEGPYTMYNHHKVKGEIYHENSKLTKSEAKRRVYDQLEKIKEEKEQLK
jgi:hypothetical protein